MSAGHTGSALVAVATYKRPRSLQTLLHSLAAESSASGPEILIVDNDPNSSAKRVATAFENCFSSVAYVNVPFPGVANARNGILDFFELSSHDYLIMIDDDQVVRAGWYREFIAASRRWPEHVIAGHVNYVLTDDVDTYVQEWYRARRGWRDGDLLRSTGTGNVLLPRQTWIQAGAPKFDSRFNHLGGEDADFFSRLIDSGAAIRGAKAVVVDEVSASDRLSRQWVRAATIRNGEISGTISASTRGRPLACVGGVARLGVGVLYWVLRLLRDRKSTPAGDRRILGAIGFLRGAMGVRSDFYGEERRAR